MKYILAIDQSTSATKAILFDAVGNVMDKAARDHRQIYPQPGWVEHDAEEIWQNVLAVIREVVERNPAHLAELVGLSITNQRETVLIFDRESGKPLHNAMVWQCRRGDALCRALSDQGHAEAVKRQTGLKIDTYFSASKIAWLMTEKPELAAQLRAGTAVIGTIDTYLIHRLTQGKSFVTDFTNASRTLLFDIGKLSWDAGLCKLFGVPLTVLPEVRESAAVYGWTTAGGILPQPIAITGVMGDSQAALFAQRCFEPGMAKATFGTGTSILLNIGSEFKASRSGAVTALAWVWQGQPTYAFEGLISFSAATIAWLKNQMGLIRDETEVEAMAASVPDNGGVYLVPAFSGLSAPYWAPEARAAIVGLTAFSKKEHVVRAAQEAIAYQIRDVLDMMRSDAQVELKQLQADGGPTRNGFLMQFTADLTGVELCVAEVAEASAWGAAMNGLLGLGIYQSPADFAALSRKAKSFKPQLNQNQVKPLHDGWLAAVQRVL